MCNKALRMSKEEAIIEVTHIQVHTTMFVLKG